MAIERKPDHPKSEFLRARKKQRLVRRIVTSVIVAVLLAGAAVFVLKTRTNPAVEESDDAPKVADTEKINWTKPVHDWRADEYVGSQTCSDCHPEIAEMYAEHPMANTMELVADSELEEISDGDSVEFEAVGCRYRVERDGNRLIHTEFMTDADGNTVYEQPMEVQYAAGSATKSYLIDRGGSLTESPISWYSEKQKWDLSPGYHDNPRQRFNRRVSDGCVQCHAGRVAPAGEGMSDRFEEPPFLEMPIGCERCHGPGKQHVEKMESGDWDSENATAEELGIVNPAQLDRHLADAVCYQCHMDGKRRILRKGRSYHDFQPGMATEDIWTVFVEHTLSETGESQPFTSQVQQMHSSACFRGSDGQMRCTSCHDPHFAPQGDEKAAFYRERCNRCHTEHGCAVPLEEREQPPALNSCIHCHMPVVGSSDIPHTSQSDHRVLRDPHNQRDVPNASGSGKLWSIYDDSEQRLPEWELQRARALALCDQAVEESNKQLILDAVAALEAVLARDANDLDAWRKLGYLYELTQNHAKAKSAFESALRIDPEDEMSLKNLGYAAFRTRAVDLGLRSYEDYIEIKPWDATMYAPYVRMLAASGDLQKAAATAERGLEFDPTQRELRDLAAKLYDRLGNQEKSRQHLDALREISSRLDPWDRKRRDRLRSEAQQNSQP